MLREIVECCPSCESEVVMDWDVEKDGFKTICPHCGERLMLCDECLHDENGNQDCDYNSITDSCKYNKENENVHKS